MDTNNIVEKVKELIQKGNVSRVIVRREGKELVNVPVNVGVIGGVLAPKLLLVSGVLATVGFGCSVEVIKTDGQVLSVVSEEDTRKVRAATADVVEKVKTAINPEKTEEADFEQAVAAEEPVDEEFSGE